MAAITYPTWAEVQRMGTLERTAIAIVKGLTQGDEFIWDFEGVDPESGKHMVGAWKSWLQKHKASFRGEESET